MVPGLIAWISLALVVLFSVVPAWGQADEKAKLVEGAKKKGRLVWYTSTNVTESKPLLDDFEKQYPFVKGEIFRASGEKTLNRIVTEARAGRSEFDLVTISEVDALVEAKLLAPYQPPKRKSIFPSSKIRKAIGRRFISITRPLAITQRCQRKGRAQTMGRSIGSEMERQDLHRSGAISLVWHPA